MFDANRHCIVVVGAQWGDEGKGKIVDVVSERADLVIRYQGGANAGHTVVCGDEEFVLHQIPTGILQPSARCVVGNGVVLDPETLLAEIAHLEERGVQLGKRLVVSDRAHLVLPYHKLLDAARERHQKIGTTGRGIGPTYEDKFGRRGVRAGDLRRIERAKEIVGEGVHRANRLLEMLESDERANLEAHLELLERLAPKLEPMLVDAGRVAYDAIRTKKNVLLEGAQGALLDVDHGTYPFVTSSNTTAGGAAVGSGIGPTVIDAVLGVVKAYTTRVGNGPLPTEAIGASGDRLRDVGGEYGATTGRPRRCGWFDAVVARYAARINGLTDLAVTKLDVLDEFPSIPLCVAYEIDGNRTENLPSDVTTLDQVKPVLYELDGWTQPITETRRLRDLPRQARSYLDTIQELLQTPIAYVSVGTRRDQIIEV